jgi:hypothetical protein
MGVWQGESLAYCATGESPRCRAGAFLDQETVHREAYLFRLCLPARSCWLKTAHNCNCYTLLNQTKLICSNTPFYPRSSHTISSKTQGRMGTTSTSPILTGSITWKVHIITCTWCQVFCQPELPTLATWSFAYSTPRLKVGWGHCRGLLRPTVDIHTYNLYHTKHQGYHLSAIKTQNSAGPHFSF